MPACLTAFLTGFCLSLSVSGAISSSTMMVSRPQGCLHGPIPLKAGSMATQQCWMNSQSNTWPRTAARWRTSCSGSKLYYRFDPYLRDINEHKHANTYSYVYTRIRQEMESHSQTRSQTNVFVFQSFNSCVVSRFEYVIQSCADHLISPRPWFCFFPVIRSHKLLGFWVWF